MDHTQFKSLLTKLVRSVSDAFPVKFISNISFLHDEALVIACFWEDAFPDEAAANREAHPSVIFYEEYESLLPNKIEIAGIDREDNPFSLFLPVDFMYKRPAA